MASRKTGRQQSKRTSSRTGQSRTTKLQSSPDTSALLAECKNKLAMRDFDGLLSTIQNANLNATTPSRLHYYAGEAHLNKGSIPEAIQHFETAIAADTTDQHPYISLFRCYAALGARDSARRAVERGLAACRETTELKMLAHTCRVRATISACLIVKDEEELLPGCLDSIRDWVDEIIVVDTGSTDKTPEIAKSFGAKVYRQPWEGDFSKARNYSISHATGDWILIIDADERVNVEDVQIIANTLANSGGSVVSVNVFNTYEQNKNVTVFLPSVRFFKRDLGLKYKGIVHNQLALPEGTQVLRTGIRFTHLGYGLSAERMVQKQVRTRKLLEKQLEENPDNPFALFNYAQLLRSDANGFSTENIPAIIKSASRAVELTDVENPDGRHIHLMCLDQLAWAYFFDRQYDKAIGYCTRALAHKPNYLDPLILLGHIYTQQTNYRAAISAFQRYLEVRQLYDPTLETDNIILLHLNSQTIAYYSVAMAYELSHEIESAKECYLKTLSLDPGYLAANERLARLLYAEGEFGEARRYFNQQLEISNPTPELLNDLGNCSFKLGDNSDAQRQYRKVLALAPSYAPALRNLGLSLARTGQVSEAAELLEKYLMEQSEPGIMEIIADLYCSIGRPGRAVPHLEAQLQLDPANSRILFRLAECYLAMGHGDAALIGYRRVLLQDPDFAPAQARISQIEQASAEPVTRV